MATSYRYLVDQSADEFAETLSRRDRRVLRDFFRYLANHPSTTPDQQFVDATDRTTRVNRHDRFVVTYWIDDAAREVRILAIELF